MLEICKDVVERFFSTVAEDGNITFQYFDDKKLTKKAGHFTQPLDVAIPVLTKLNNDGCGIYFMVNEGDGHGRSEANVTRVRALFVDLDGAPLDAVHACKLEPHIIVESSKGRFHAYWIVSDCSFDKFRSMQVALAKKFGGDTSVNDLPRVLRVPGFWHLKYEPFQTRLVRCEPTQPYTVAQVSSELELTIEVAKVENDERKPLAPFEQTLSLQIQPGDRHRTLLQYASKYAHNYSLSFSEIKLLIDGMNLKSCVPPKPQVEVDQIIHDAMRYAAVERQKNEDIDLSVTLQRNRVAVKKMESKIVSLPDHIMRPPGLVGDVFNYIMDTSTKLQPELSLAAAFCAVGALVGRKVRSPSNLRTNIYCISLIETGAGKDWPRQAVKKIFRAAGAEVKASVEDLASDAAIAEALDKAPSQVFLLDELGLLLKAISSPNAGTHLTGIISTLMKAFSSANTHWNAKSYADAKFNREIDQPNLCLLGTTVPNNFYDNITKDSVSDGFLNRMLVFTSNFQEPEIREVQSFDPPESLVSAFDIWEKIPYRRDGGNLADTTSVEADPMVVPYFGKARQIFDDFESDLRSLRTQLRADGGGMAGLFTRSREHAIKIALILAAGNNYLQPMITEEEAEYGCTLVGIQSKNLFESVCRNVADNRTEKHRIKVLEAIRASGVRGVSAKDLCRRLRSISKRERVEILEELETAGEIAKRSESSSGGRPKVSFFLTDDLPELRN